VTVETPATLAAALADACRRWPRARALTCRHHELTYAALGQAVTELAELYRRLGVAPGDRVACSVANRCEHLVAMGAAWTCGAVHVCVDHRATVHEVTTALGRTGATTLLYEPDADLPDPVRPLELLRRRHPELRMLVVTDHLVPRGFLRWRLTGPEAAPAGTGRRTVPPGGPAPADPAIVFISSGTTGAPKATVGLHGNLAQRWRRLAEWLRFSSNDVHLAQLPLSHGFGLMMAVSALLAGGRLVLLDEFSPEAALSVVGAEGVTVLNGAPAHFTLLLDRLDPDRHRVDTLRLCVGTAAPFRPGLVNSIWERLGVDFMLMYGSSEGVGVATTDPEDILRGSVGRPAPGSVAIVGSDHRPVPPGSVGEVAFSRAFYPVQYWGDPEHRGTAPSSASAKEREADWFYSGDLGRLDDRGCLYIHGRIKHQIDRVGVKIDPVEVEAALMRCPDVADAAVIGQTDRVLGETVAACVSPAAGYTPTLDGMRRMLAETLSPYKLPEQLYLLDRIPRTPIGKVDLPRLRRSIAGVAAHDVLRR